MAVVSIKYSSILFLARALLFQGALGDFMCGDLPTNVCAFAISSSGKRCLLENSAGKNGKVEYQCKTSDVLAKMKEHIETDGCVDACGVDRNSIGISSDSLLEPQFAAKLCSPACHQHCDNIVDLYFHLAAGEGVFLPDLCNKQKNSQHRGMIELSNNGAAAENAYAPAPYSRDF